MKNSMKKLTLILTLMGVLVLSSCQVQQTSDEGLTKSVEETTTTVAEKPEETSVETTTTETTTTTEKVVVNYEELGVNEQGHILIVMYHGIMDNPPYHRTKEEFNKDLQTMYDLGYRLITMEDFINGHIDVPAGTTPIHLTFDDGLDSTFSLKETADGFVADPDTAIGILEDFCEAHPDFGKAASLYFHDTEYNFGDVGTDKERFDWLLEHGYELGNHTATHANLSQLTQADVLEEVGRVEKYYESLYPDKKFRVLAYPFGARPDDSYFESALKGEYDGTTYDYEIGLREGPSGPFLPYTHKDFQKYNAPRVRGSEGENGDMYWYFEYYQDNPSLKYISDGDPNTIVIPEAMDETLSDYARENFEIIEY